MLGGKLKPTSQADDTWDAGEMGCGELVIMLRARMLRLAAGQTLHLIARDLGAPEDLPAWCGMTGHRLLHSFHPDYLIQRRKDT